MIKGDYIILRTIRERDLEHFFTLSSNIREMDNFWPVTLKNESDLYNQYKNGSLWSEDRGLMLITTLKGEIIGEISYFKGVCYLPGYEINFNIFNRENRKKEYFTEALDLFSNYLFELWPIQRLETTATRDNNLSKEIIKQCGYKLEGVKRECFFLGGKYHDLELYSLIRGEEKPFREALPS